MTIPRAQAETTSGNPILMLALATARLRGQLLGLGADQPARPAVPRLGRPRRAQRVRRRAAGRGPGGRRLAGPDPGRRAHRPATAAG